ncbi:Diaphanous [Nowakowskiella sp. JEL0407]|nr:Diaphanous [Nowakowskiella sp. JEL0407]
MTKTPLQRKPVSRVPVQKSNIPTDQEYRKSFSTCNLSTSNNDVVPASTENSRPPSILYTNETLTTNSTASNDFFISDHITQISTLKDKKITSLEQPGGFKRSNSQYKAPVTQHRRAYSLMRPRQRKNTVIDPHNFMVNNNNNQEAKIKWVNSVKKSQLHTLKSVEQLPDSKILDFSYNELINEVAPTDFSLKTKSDNSLDEKLRIVQSSFRLLEGSTKASLQPPQFYVDILKLYVARKKLESNTPLSSVGLRGVQILESISRTLSRQPELFEILAELKGNAPSFTTTWTQGFLELGGFEILFHILKTVQLKKDRKTKHLEIELSIVRVLRHLIVQEGPRRLLKIFTNTENIQVVVNILDHPTIVAHTCFAELLLSVVTLGNDGLESVHQAFQKLKEKYKEPRTYCTFISLLRKVVQGRGVFGTDVGARKWSGADIFGSGDKSSTKIKDQREDIIEFVTTFVALLRYMTEYTADLVARIHLRNTFNSCGLNEIFQTIKTFSDDYQDACNHIEEFESAAEMDLTEFASNSEFRFEYDPLDPLAIVYNLQSNLVNEEESWRSVVSILQTMSLSLKIHDKSYRKLMFGVISEVVSQLILDQRGFCSESRSFAQIDVAKLGEKQAKKQIEQVESEKSKLEKKLEEAHEKIRNHDKETADTIESLKARHAEQLMNLQSELANITQQVKEKESEEINATEESQSNDDPTTAVSQTSDQNISMATSTSILGLPPPPPPLPDAPRPSIFKQKIVPAVKMKCLQWEKLSDRSIKSTIWEKINDPSKLEEEQKLLQKHGVFKELEENFAAKAAVSDKFNNGFAKNAAKVQILGSTVAQNVAIAIKQNKSATPETIKNAIIKMNEEILKENIIDSILSNYPDKTVVREK